MHAGVHASAVEAMQGWSRGPCPGRPIKEPSPAVPNVAVPRASGVAGKGIFPSASTGGKRLEKYAQ
jgi:hypothetical protein